MRSPTIKQYQVRPSVGLAAGVLLLLPFCFLTGCAEESDDETGVVVVQGEGVDAARKSLRSRYEERGEPVLRRHYALDADALPSTKSAQVHTSRDELLKFAGVGLQVRLKAFGVSDAVIRVEDEMVVVDGGLYSLPRPLMRQDLTFVIPPAPGEAAKMLAPAIALADRTPWLTWDAEHGVIKTEGRFSRPCQLLRSAVLRIPDFPRHWLGYQRGEGTCLLRTARERVERATVKQASSEKGPSTGVHYLSIELDEESGERFHALTQEYLNQQMMMVVGDDVLADPVIRSEIPGGKVSVEMGGLDGAVIKRETEEMASRLSGRGPFPPVRFVKESVVQGCDTGACDPAFYESANTE